VDYSKIIPRLEKLVGAKIETFHQVQGGYTPAVRLVCATVRASFFAKVGVTPPTDAYIRREIQIYNRIHRPFLPRLIGCEENGPEPILVIEDLSSCHWPPPWEERQIKLVLAQIEAMHSTTAPIETFAEVWGDSGANWHSIAADPAPFLSLGLATSGWLDKALPLLLENATRCSTAGTRLTHNDLRSDNICIGRDRALFVDWNLACLSNPTLDLGFMLPSLAYESGRLPESILPDSPDVAAYVSGYFAARAGLPVIPEAPHVRQVQLRQLETALPWAIRALGLPPTVRKTPPP
jgi:thiamine kinase-like enzyme